MKKIILTAVATLLAVACSQETDWTAYNGDYSVSDNTEIIQNGHSVQLSDYENAEISIAVLDGNNCEITLRNFIAGQPEVIVPGSLSEDATKAAAAAGISFSGSTGTTDRTVTIAGVTSGSTIASINISEEITVDGIPGAWTLQDARLTFRHPELTEIDLSALADGLVINVDDLISQLNDILKTNIQDGNINPDPFVLTEDGYLNAPPVCYYVRPSESTLYIFLSKSTVEMIIAELEQDPDAMAMLNMLGFSSLIENPQSMNIPLQYTTDGSTLTLTATQALLDPYEAMLSQPIAVIRTLLSQFVTYDLITALAVDFPEIAGIITEENFPIFQQILLDTYDTLTDGQAEYSVTIEFHS